MMKCRVNVRDESIPHLSGRCRGLVVFDVQHRIYFLYLILDISTLSELKYIAALDLTRGIKMRSISQPDSRVISSKGIYHGLPDLSYAPKGMTAIVTGANGISGAHMVSLNAFAAVWYEKLP